MRDESQARPSHNKENSGFEKVLQEKKEAPKSLEAPSSQIGLNRPYKTQQFDPLRNKNQESITQHSEESSSLSSIRKNPFKFQKSSNLKIDQLIKKHAKENGIDPNLLAGLIKQESGGKPRIVSKAGAMGLTQLMPETARQLGVKDPFDPGQNIAGGAKYLKMMLDKFGGNEKLALAAYNAGPSAVKKYKGIPPYNETQNYVDAVLSHAEKIRLKGSFS